MRKLAQCCLSNFFDETILHYITQYIHTLIQVHIPIQLYLRFRTDHIKNIQCIGDQERKIQYQMKTRIFLEFFILAGILYEECYARGGKAKTRVNTFTFTKQLQVFKIKILCADDRRKGSLYLKLFFEFWLLTMDLKLQNFKPCCI